MLHPIEQSQNSMPVYRVYIIGDDGRVRTSIPLIVASDNEAVAEARRFINGRPVELWDRGRLIVRF